MFCVYVEIDPFSHFFTDDMFTQSEQKAADRVDELRDQGKNAWYEWVLP